MTDQSPDDREAMRAYVRRLLPRPSEAEEHDEHGNPVDPWRLAVRRLMARGEDE